MADTSRFVTLKALTAEVLALSGKPKSKYYTFFQTILNGVRDIQLFHGTTIRRVLLDMDANYVVDLPGDFLSFLAIGISVNGKLHLFTRDDSLLAIATTDPVYDWSSDLDEKSVVGPGVRGGKNSDVYNIDYENNRIVFNSPEVRSEIILHYISSGIDATAETSVPVITKMCLISYTLWRDALMTESTYYNRIEILRQDYEREVEKLRMLQMPTIEEIRDEVRKSYRMSPKR